MPLKEQQGPERGTTDLLEQMGSKDIANELTNYDWELFTAMHEVTPADISPQQINHFCMYSIKMSSLKQRTGYLYDECT